MMKTRSHALLFVAAGLYLAIGALAGFHAINAVLLLLIGIDRFRRDRSKLAVALIVISGLTLVVTQFAFFVVILLLSLGVYYVKARPSAPGAGVVRNMHRLIMNMRQDEQSWVLQSFSCWHAVGEIRLDLTRAVPETKDTIIVLQGLVGDVELAIPEDYGLQVEASVLLGQVGFGSQKESGFLHRLNWRSPDFEHREHRLILQLFYLVGDIRIRTV